MLPSDLWSVYDLPVKEVECRITHLARRGNSSRYLVHSDDLQQQHEFTLSGDWPPAEFERVCNEEIEKAKIRWAAHSGRLLPSARAIPAKQGAAQ